MKKRRTLIISLLLIAALALGIGYAATSGTLEISGEATTNEQSFNVVFTKAKLVEKTTTAKASTAGGAELTTEGTDLGNRQIVQLDVSELKNAGDYVTVEFTVENHNEFPMYISKNNIEISGFDGSPFKTPNVELAQDVVKLEAVGADNDADTTTVTITFQIGDNAVSESGSYSYSINLRNVTSVNPTNP